MDVSARSWKGFFCTWPAEIARQGLLVTSFGEQVPFSGFMTGETFLLIERKTPDPSGARAIVLPYDEVVALKITDVLKPKAYRSFGFEGPSAAK